MDLGTAVAGAWSAGISMYGVIAVLGVAGRLGWLDTGDLLQQPWVIGGAVALFLVEFVVDKVAVLDTVWDAVHTVLRPAAGAVLVGATPDHPLPPWLLVVVGAGLALSSHSAKASVRAMVNASPEPASNVVVSLTEDGLVAVVMALAIAYPAVALVVTLVLAVASAVVAVVLFRASRAAWRRVRARWSSRDPGPPRWPRR
jgi:hypothetical protein